LRYCCRLRASFGKGTGPLSEGRSFLEFIGKRLREAREALGLDVAAFYAPAAARDKRDKPDKCPQMSRT